MILDTNMSEERKSFTGIYVMLIPIFCLSVGILFGMQLGIYQIGEAHIFEKMAEGMTCEALKDAYVEDPEPVFGLPDDESSWWFVFESANDAMGEEITKRCITGLDSGRLWHTAEPNGRVYEYTIAP